jgi:hypothetical protein
MCAVILQRDAYSLCSSPDYTRIYTNKKTLVTSTNEGLITCFDYSGFLPLRSERTCFLTSCLYQLASTKLLMPEPH